MPGAGFKTFSAGSVLTASDVNTYLMQQAVMVFTNEAARDAAITSPSEGMIAYLTAPTVPAATGTTTILPSGIKTIYNGSAWVCVTEVSALSGTTGTTTSGSYVTTLTGDATAVSVTLSTGTTALVSMGFRGVNSTTSQTSMVYSVSGATTIAASSANEITTYGTGVFAPSQCFVLTGLTAGTNTITLNYSISSASTGTFYRRFLCVKGIA